MFSSWMPFGQTASHSPMFVQLPKPSSLAWATMFNAREWRSGWPWGSRPRWLILAPVNSDALALGQAATQAPQPMHAAADMAISDSGLGTRIALPSVVLPVGTLM